MIYIDFYDAIFDIINANENRKLVIFAGAGISKNSNLPTWNDLIIEMAKKTDYTICDRCNFREENECENDFTCNNKYNFSQDEYLKIPQYLFNKNKEEYFLTIKENLDKDVNSNPINDIILKLNPTHIITTNYDRLFEKSKELNKTKFSHIYKDSDLLNAKTNQYLVKMHGDIKSLDSIVLKEDDYIHYSQNHILIETFIKSLMIDHVFVFVGYSLNDSNLKLILGWIDYLVKQNSVKRKDRTKNYILTSDKSFFNNYSIEYWEKKNIFLINPYHCPSEILKKAKKTSLKSEVGQSIYAFFDILINKHKFYWLDSNYLERFLLDKVKILLSFEYVSFYSICYILGIKSYKIAKNTLFLYENDKFELLKKVVLNKNCIKSIFYKSNIKYIATTINTIDNCFEIDYTNNFESENYTFFNLYLDQNYIEIMNRIERCCNVQVKAYYYYLVTRDAKKSEKILNNMYSENEDINIIYKYFIYIKNKSAFIKLQFITDDNTYFAENTLSSTENKAYKYFFDIFKDTSYYTKELNSLLENLKKYYMKSNKNVYYQTMNSIDDYESDNFLRIQSISYDYYLFLRYNNICLYSFKESHNFLKYYIEAIFCTYYPYENTYSEIYRGSFYRLSEKYTLNKIDVDILTKFCYPKYLKELIKKYRVNNLKVDSSLKFEVLFENFCNGMYEYSSLNKINEFDNFCILVSILEIKKDIANEIVDIIFNIVFQKYDHIRKLRWYIYSIKEILYTYKDEEIKRFTDILLIICDITFLKELIKDELKIIFEILRLSEKYYTQALYEKVDKQISEEFNYKVFCSVIPILSKFEKEKYTNFVFSKINAFSEQDIFNFIFWKYIIFNDNFKNYFINLADKFSLSNDYAYYESVNNILLKCINLYLLHFFDDIEFLRKHKDKSIYLEFIFNPNEFDYSNVDITIYTWYNLFLNEKYRNILIEHKEKFITDDLKNDLYNGNLTKKEIKLIIQYNLFK